MRDHSHLRTNPAPQEPHEALKRLGPDIVRFLGRQCPQWSQALGAAFQEEMERALLEGLTAAFRTLADQLPRLLAESCGDVPPPATEEPATLSLLPAPDAEAAVEQASTAETQADLPLVRTTELVPLREPAPGDREAARVHYRRGTDRARARDFDGAVAHYTEALRLHPRHRAAYLARGQVFRLLGQLDHAAADFREAIALRPAAAFPHLCLGNTCLAQRRWDEAVSACTEAIRADPGQAAAFLYRGLAHANQGEHGRAIADFDGALALQPSLVVARFHRALCYRLKGEHDLAIVDFTEVIQLRSDFPRVFFHRGLAHVAAGRHDQAVADFDRALEIDSQDGEARARRDEAAEIRDRPRALPAPAAPAPEPPAPVAPEPADPTFLALECPACGAPAKISWKRLDRLFKCRQCARVFRMNREGRLAEVDPTGGAARRRWANKRALLAGVGGLLLAALAAWWHWGGARQAVEDELPADLKSRGELWAKAWLDKDRPLLRRLTASTHDRLLHPWLERHRPPFLKAPAAGEESSPRATIQVDVKETRPAQAVVTISVRAPSLRAPVDVRLNWTKRGETWYFVPSAKG